MAQAKLNGECSAGRAVSHLTAGSSVMNPGEIGLPKQDRKILALRGLHQAHRGYSAPLQQGLKVEQAGHSENKFLALISYSVSNRVQYAVHGSVCFCCPDLLFPFSHCIFGDGAYRPSSWRSKVSLFSHLQHLSISQWDGVYHVSFPFLYPPYNFCY